MAEADVCRLCLGRNELSIVFEMSVGANLLEDIIYTVTGVMITKQDLVSKFVCSKCQEIIVQMYKFRCMANKNDQFLKQRWTTINIKSEADILDFEETKPTITNLPLFTIQLDQASNSDQSEEPPFTIEPEIVMETEETAKEAQTGSFKISNVCSEAPSRKVVSVDSSSNEEQEKYTCHECKKSFFEFGDLQVHRKEHLICSYCKEKFRSKILIKKHQSKCAKYIAVKNADSLKVELVRLNVEKYIKPTVEEKITTERIDIKPLNEIEIEEMEVSPEEISEQLKEAQIEYQQDSSNEMSHEDSPLVIDTSYVEEEQTSQTTDVKNPELKKIISIYSSRRKRNKACQIELKYDLCMLPNPSFCAFLNWMDVLRTYKVPILLNCGKFSVKLSGPIKKSLPLIDMWEEQVQHKVITFSSFKIENPKYAKPEPKTYVSYTQVNDKNKSQEANKTVTVSYLPASLLDMDVKQLILLKEAPNTPISLKKVKSTSKLNLITNEIVARDRRANVEFKTSDADKNLKKVKKKISILKSNKTKKVHKKLKLDTQATIEVPPVNKSVEIGDNSKKINDEPNRVTMPIITSCRTVTESDVVSEKGTAPTILNGACAAMFEAANKFPLGPFSTTLPTTIPICKPEGADGIGSSGFAVGQVGTMAVKTQTGSVVLMPGTLICKAKPNTNS